MAAKTQEDKVHELARETYLELKKISKLTITFRSTPGTFHGRSDAISRQAEDAARKLARALEEEGYDRIDDKWASDTAYDWVKSKIGFMGPPDKFEPAWELVLRQTIDSCFKSATETARATRKSNPEIFNSLTTYRGTFEFCAEQRINLYKLKLSQMDPNAKIRIPDIYQPDLSTWNLESPNFELPCLDVIDAGNRSMISKDGKLIAGNFKTYNLFDTRVYSFFNSMVGSWHLRIQSDMNDEEYWASQKKQGCYIATAVYGSYDCPEVWTLRRFRDYELAESIPGRAFIKAYYAISPTLVKRFGNTQWFRNMWRGFLDRLVDNCNAKGHANTPYKDKVW